jgi:Domain of unknown function (DUF4055)
MATAPTQTERHPEYTAEVAEEWRLMRDAYRGESAVKRRGEVYLPKPSGFKHHPDPTIGAAMYEAYMKRARFPEIVASAVRGMVGIAHAQEWQIDLPPALEYLWEGATKDKIPLEVFCKRITTELLITGRYSVLADAPASGGEIYLAGYGAESLVNWSDMSDFFVLEELDYDREGMAWKPVIRARVLEVIDGRYVQKILDDGAEVEEYTPSARGGKALDFIPLSVGGAMDLDLTPDAPPLIGVARAALAHYQLNADYRHQLYMSGQETLFLYNVPKDQVPSVIGAGVIVALESGDATKNALAEYVGPAGSGIDAHAAAMDREQQSAIRSGAQLFDNSKGNSQESGDARRLRFSAETATLSSIVGASAAILERALKNAAIMAGADPDAVVVAPPQNLLEGRLDAQELTALVSAWEKGAFGHETLYENLQRGRIANPERDLADETAQITRDTEARSGFLPDAAEGDNVTQQGDAQGV